MKSADFVVVLNMLLDQEMLAVNDVCRIEECCASVYANVSCSQKLLLRRVAAYQWRGISLFCTKARRIFAQLAEHVQFLVRHRATLVALRSPTYMIETARCELRKWKSILRRYCEFVQVNFCDMISETQEVTQTDYSFWQVLLQVEADKLEHFFDTKRRYDLPLSSLKAGKLGLFVDTKRIDASYLLCLRVSRHAPALGKKRQGSIAKRTPLNEEMEQQQREITSFFPAPFVHDYYFLVWPASLA